MPVPGLALFYEPKTMTEPAPLSRPQLRRMLRKARRALAKRRLYKAIRCRDTKLPYLI